MKVKVCQPLYSRDYTRSEELFAHYLQMLDECDDSLDIIVLPESCDVPAFADSYETSLDSINKYRDVILKKASATAKRCNAIVFVNVHYQTDTGLRNTTVMFGRGGEELFHYYKQHLTPGETSKYYLDTDYTYEYEEPYYFDYEGVRYGFLICYDFYFYEIFAAMARKNIDVIIGCSHQRTDTHATLEMINKFCSYHTNAYLLRSSVSFGEDCPVAGCSCVIAPDGTVISDLKSKVGSTIVDIDPKSKYFKPAGYGGDVIAHYEYIERGRRPWKYRPSGSAIVRHDEIMPYPRTCAHRGFSAAEPENTLPAFGAAIALGADEIEFDVRATKDGVLVALHDPVLERVSNGNGRVEDYTYEQLLKLDFGAKHGDKYAGLKIATFEEVLKKFACHTVMNIHVKLWDEDAENPMYEEIIGLVKKYDCEKYCYFMTVSHAAHAKLIELAPNIKRCLGGCGNWSLVDDAIEVKAHKVQLCKPCVSKEMVDKAHAHGIKCNVFWSDTPEETEAFLDMGVDCILTNNYLVISRVVEKYKNN